MCEVLAKSYPKDGYAGEYWDKVSDDWAHNNRCGYCDSYDRYSVIYHDGMGNITTCTIELDEEALEEIKNAPPQER